MTNSPIFNRAKVAARAAALAAKGVYVGTSSWKYPGWCGQIYDRERYVTRGKFAESRFERECLTEYASVFKTVCVDAAYYRFPEPGSLAVLSQQVPDGFKFAYKVTDTITVKKFPNMPRFGERAGKANANFLNANLFWEAYAQRFEPFRDKVGLFMFEFSKFYPSDYAHGRDFIADLDHFLEHLPKRYPYGVEMRNKHWLEPDYFAVLRKHGVAHVFNSWSDMPSVGEQMALKGSRTNDSLTAARFLTAPGVKYADSIKMFEPYDKTKAPYPEGVSAGANLVKEGLAGKGKLKVFVFVNNRLEGNALETIARILEQVRPTG